MTTKNQPLSDLEIASQAVIKPITEIANIPEGILLRAVWTLQSKDRPIKNYCSGRGCKGSISISYKSNPSW